MTSFQQVLHRGTPLGMVAATAATIAVLAPQGLSPVGAPQEAGWNSIGILHTSAETKSRATSGPPVDRSTGKPTFAVRVGSLTGIAPGAQGGLPVQFGNPFPFGIKVVSYTAAASVAGTDTACPASNLVVPSGTVRLHTARVVPAGGTEDITVPVTLSAGAPPACQRAAFTVMVTATAVNR